MKRIVLILALLTSFVTGFSQEKTNTADRVVAKTNFFLYDWWITRIQRDTSFTGHTDYLPTSDAVKKFVEGRDNANFYTKAQLETSGQSLVHWDNITNKPAIGGVLTFLNGLTLTGSNVTLGGTIASRTLLTSSGTQSYLMSGFDTLSFKTSGTGYTAIGGNKLDLVFNSSKLHISTLGETDLAQSTGARNQAIMYVDGNNYVGQRMLRDFDWAPVTQYDTTYKPAAFGPDGKLYKTIGWFSSDNLYTKNGTIASNRTVSIANGITLAMTGGQINFTSQLFDGQGYSSLNPAQSVFGAVQGGTGFKAEFKAVANTSLPVAFINATKDVGGALTGLSTQLMVAPDSFYVSTHSGIWGFKFLAQASDTSVYKPIARDPVSGHFIQFPYWPAAPGGGGGGGMTTTQAAQLAALWDASFKGTHFANLGNGDTVLVALNDSTFAFKSDSLYAASSKIAVNKTITANMRKYGLDVNEANLTLGNLGGTLPATKGGTGFTSFTKGDLLVAQNSTTLIKVAAGTDGQVLTANSATTSGLEWQAGGGGGGGGTDYVKLQSGTVTAGSSSLTIDLGVNYNQYSAIEVFIQGVTFSVANEKFELRLSSDGSTYASGSTDYKFKGAPGASGTDAGQIELVAGFPDVSTVPGASVNGRFFLTNHASSSLYTQVEYYFEAQTWFDGDIIINTGRARRAVAETDRYFMLLPSSGTFAIGSYSIYGRK